MSDPKMLEKIANGKGFIAALDQSGGSTPKALLGYGIEESAYSGDEEMFGADPRDAAAGSSRRPRFHGREGDRRDPV